MPTTNMVCCVECLKLHHVRSEQSHHHRRQEEQKNTPTTLTVVEQPNTPLRTPPPHRAIATQSPSAPHLRPVPDLEVFEADATRCDRKSSRRVTILRTSVCRRGSLCMQGVQPPQETIAVTYRATAALQCQHSIPTTAGHSSTTTHSISQSQHRDE